MKAISLHQPYASFIAWGIKKHETRSWYPPFSLRKGEHLIIHAAKRKLGDEERQLCALPSIAAEFTKRGITPDKLPLGALVCITEYVQAKSTDTFRSSGMDQALGNYQPGRWAWELKLIRPLDAIRYNGQQGIFNVPDEIITSPVVAPPPPKPVWQVWADELLDHPIPGDPLAARVLPIEGFHRWANGCFPVGRDANHAEEYANALHEYAQAFWRIIHKDDTHAERNKHDEPKTREAQLLGAAMRVNHVTRVMDDGIRHRVNALIWS